MIARLDGILDFIHEGYAIVNVNGVGYKVFLPNKVLSQHPKATPISVYIYTHIRENAFDLYGFPSFPDQLLFEKMIGISGIGPKIAIGVFQFGSGEDIMQAIQSSDLDFFTQVPRFGKKNAQKLILELKGSIDTLLFEEDAGRKEHETVIAALQNFGFSKSESLKALSEIKEKGLSIEAKIRRALQILGK